MNPILLFLLVPFVLGQEAEVQSTLLETSESTMSVGASESVAASLENSSASTGVLAEGASTTASIITGTTPTLQVDCSSGAVDSATQLDSLTDAECVTRCEAKCANVATEDEADECLGEDELLGCLFDVQHLRMVKTEYCQTTNNTDTSSAVTVPAIVYELSEADLAYYGDGNEVHEVWLSMNVTDISVLKNQCQNSVKLGVSLEVFDQSTCLYHGLAGTSQAFGLPEASIGSGTITTNVTDILSGSYGSSAALTLFAEFTDPACGTITVEDVGLVFAMQYKTGYRPSKTCSSVESCTGCLANGCTWCDWNGTVNTLLPGWLPDWDWIEEAKEKNNGLCGINSAVCRTSLGSVNKCGALSNLMVPSVGALVAMLAYVA